MQRSAVRFLAILVPHHLLAPMAWPCHAHMCDLWAHTPRSDRDRERSLSRDKHSILLCNCTGTLELAPSAPWAYWPIVKAVRAVARRPEAALSK